MDHGWCLVALGDGKAKDQDNEERWHDLVNKYWRQGSSGSSGGRRGMKRWTSTILSSWQSGGAKVFLVWGFYLSSDCQPVRVKQMDKMSILYFYFCFLLRFLFIFGWLRVAETLYNPFGEDDEDFELNELLNRHFRGNYNGFQILPGYPIELFKYPRYFIYHSNIESCW